jgi:hypothetical protein
MAMAQLLTFRKNPCGIRHCRAKGFHQTFKLKYWCGVSGENGLITAPVLEFVVN